jgi:hypothetical protein
VEKMAASTLHWEAKKVGPGSALEANVQNIQYSFFKRGVSRSTANLDQASARGLLHHQGSGLEKRTKAGCLRRLNQLKKVHLQELLMTLVYFQAVAL